MKHNKYLPLVLLLSAILIILVISTIYLYFGQLATTDNVSVNTPVQNESVPTEGLLTDTSQPKEMEPTSAELSPTESSTETVIASPEPTETPIPTTAPQPVPPPFPISGIEIHNKSGVQLSADANAYWIRRNALTWSVVEPVEGSRNWNGLASLENEMISISEKGMEMILIIHYVPSWAQDVYGYACGPVKADKIPAFAAFMHDVVARYSQPPYNVKFYEIGNEPDVPWAVLPGGSQYGCWIDSEDPNLGADRYAQTLQAVYPQVKAANPDAQVLVGGLLMDCDPLNPPVLEDGSQKNCLNSRFLEFVMNSGGANSFDGVSFHAYDYYEGELGKYSNVNWHARWDTTGPVLVNKGRYLRALLNYYNRPDAYLINTEIALLCGRDGTEGPCRTDAHTHTKSIYLVESNTIAQAEGLWGNIWYSISGWRGSGLVVYSAPVPAYRAFSFNSQQLVDMPFVAQLEPVPGVVVYEFEREGRRLWVMWSRDGLDHAVLLPSVPSAAYDVYGEPLISSQEWNSTIYPVYLEWQE